jgi:alkylation response protein AidB-like acyl-CoA dehydrogenase
MRDLRDTMESRADEIEELGTMPDDLYDRLVETGYLRMTVPARFGGAECSLAEANAIIFEAARADGSAGWLAMIAAHMPIVLSRLAPDAFAALFAEGPDLRARVVGPPKGVAVPVEGGYLVSGQWAFASGGPSPAFVAGGCIVVQHGVPVIGEDGAPTMFQALMDAAQVTFLDTWKVVGLKGTNSCDFTASEVFVPTERTFVAFGGTSCLDGPLGRISSVLGLMPGHAAVALGVAHAARDELARLAQTKGMAFNPAGSLASDPHFQRALGELSLQIEVAQAFMEKQTAIVWDAATAGETLDTVSKMCARMVAPYVTALCCQAVDAAYTLAGSTSLYDSSSLQRCLRDIHVATQHIAVSSSAYAALGAAMTGQELSSPIDRTA